MEHRVEIPTSERADIDFFSDMLRVNFPHYADLILLEDMVIIVPASDLFVAEFRNDEELLHWINWLVTNGFNFTYKFIGA